MEYTKSKIKDGIQLHTIKTDRFKTNLISVFLTTKLDRETVTKNSLIGAILRRGSKNMQTQEKISMELEELYGAEFDCGIDKSGDNQVIKFYIETINDKFLPQQGEDMLKTSLEKLFEIVFDPVVEQDGFKQEYLEQEKQNMKQRIEGKIDNKAVYAIDRCMEEMYKNKPFGLYKYGYVEDLKDITASGLYNQYIKLKDECKIDIFVSGDIEENVMDIVNQNEYIKNLKEREPVYNKDSEKSVENHEQVITEKMDVTQGKLLLGLDVELENDDQKYSAMIYNSILGGSANSKLFQNVREKANLAYVASSRYYKLKNTIVVNCGIEISNYEKALNLIKEQIESIKKSDFTDEEIENAKQLIIAGINTIDDEQDTGISYCFGQELSKNPVTMEEYKKKVMEVNRSNVDEIAKKININTIYFLRD